METKNIEEVRAVAANKNSHKGNYIIEEGNTIKVFPNGVDLVPFIFDVEDKQLIERYTVYRHKNGYAVAYDSMKKKKVYLHRVVMGMLDKPSEHFIDHIDGDKNNNRKSNLRICHHEDASNARNRNKKFVGHEKVVKFRQPNDTFILNISNGIFQDIEFEYTKFGDLLDDEDILWSYGLDKGIFMLIAKNEQAALDLMNNHTKKSKGYVLAKNELNKIKWLREFLIVAYHNASYFSKNNNLPKGGIMFIENKLFINVGNSYTSKQMKEANIQPMIVFHTNQKNIKQVGKHLNKPNGSSIY